MSQFTFGSIEDQAFRNSQELAHACVSSLTILEDQFEQISEVGQIASNNRTNISVIRAESALRRLKYYLHTALSYKKIVLKRCLGSSFFLSLKKYLQQEAIKNVVCHSAVDRVFVSIDSSLLLEAVICLIHNAIEASQGSPIYVLFSNNNGEVRLDIIDSGVGLGKIKLAVLFISNRSTKQFGNGIGLLYAKRIITLHGGKIFMSSSKNMGTRVSIILPCT